MTNHKKLNLKLETIQVLSDATLAVVAGGARNGGPDQRSDVAPQAQVGAGLSRYARAEPVCASLTCTILC
jgi:hypothetical protein